MSDKEIKEIEKDKFPWDGEPNALEFVDDVTGFKCLVKRNPLGTLCGYVLLPESLLQKVKEVIEIIKELDVHGGVDFTEFMTHEVIKNHFEFLFPDIAKENYVYVVGFHCSHFGDLMPFYFIKDLDFPKEMVSYMTKDAIYKDIEFVKTECRKLAKQLHEMLVDKEV